jgi:hypothetical protein
MSPSQIHIRTERIVPVYRRQCVRFYLMHQMSIETNTLPKISEPSDNRCSETTRPREKNFFSCALFSILAMSFVRIACFSLFLPNLCSRRFDNLNLREPPPLAHIRVSSPTKNCVVTPRRSICDSALRRSAAELSGPVFASHTDVEKLGREG